MAFPAGLTLVTVTIQFDTWPLGGGDGTIRFESPSALIGPADDSIVPPIDTVLAFPDTGHATIALPACNDPDWSPNNGSPNNGWDYTVTVFIGDETIRGAVTLDYQTTAVNLADVFRLTNLPTPPTGSYVTTAQFNAAIADLEAQIGEGAVTSVNGHTGVVVLTKTDVGLGNVDNTTDAAKPISTATQTALNLKAPLASPTFTGTVSGITKAMVGLGNVDNTSDASKPVSTAAQAALDLKAPLASPAFTGTVTGITKAMVGLGNVDNTSDASKPVSTAAQAALDSKADLVGGFVPTAQIPAIAITEYLGAVGSQAAMLALTGQKGDFAARTDLGTNWVIVGNDPTQLSSWLEYSYPGAPVLSVNGQTGTVVLGKADVGLGNVDNTTDAAKPISTATQTALNLKAPLASPTFTGTVGGITKAMVGLGNVDNTSDASKAISTATQAALDLKADTTDLDGYLPLTGGTVTGNLTVRDSGTPTRAYRFKTNGSALDFDAAGLDLFVSAYAEPDFTGTQRNYLRLEADAQLAHALGRWLFAAGAFDSTGPLDVDTATGTTGVGAKNGLVNVPFAGRRSGVGPPTTGTWASADVVQAVDGFWQCTVGGTPGTWVLIAAASGADRICDAGEYVLDRDEIIGNTPATTGNLYMTHFRGARTQTVMTLKTGTGGSGTVATSASHAWIGIMDWDGTDYTPNVISVDDPTRWTSEFASYDTPIFDAATGLVQGFHEVQGQEYGMWVLWVGSGQPPALPAGVGWYQDSLEPPRKNAFFITDTPPSVPVSGAFFGPDSRRFQAQLRQ